MLQKTAQFLSYLFFQKIEKQKTVVPKGRCKPYPANHSPFLWLPSPCTPAIVMEVSWREVCICELSAILLFASLEVTKNIYFFMKRKSLSLSV